MRMTVTTGRIDLPLEGRDSLDCMDHPFRFQASLTSPMANSGRQWLLRVVFDFSPATLSSFHERMVWRLTEREGAG